MDANWTILLVNAKVLDEGLQGEENASREGPENQGFWTNDYVHSLQKRGKWKIADYCEPRVLVWHYFIIFTLTLTDALKCTGGYDKRDTILHAPDGEGVARCANFFMAVCCTYPYPELNSSLLVSSCRRSSM